MTVTTVVAPSLIRVGKIVIDVEGVEDVGDVIIVGKRPESGSPIMGSH